MDKNNSHTKRVVVDIDDTLSFTTDRNFQNATPNIPLIKKLNEMYDGGWEVIFCTARGSLSCNNRKEAEDKYKNQILEWFNKHGVKYTNISFEKILATYYIDDKSITPEDFLELDIQNIKNGLSGSFVERRGNKIFKCADNSLDAAKWYKIASNYFTVPKIHSVIGNTICLEYIEKQKKLNIFDALSIIDKMKFIPYPPIMFSTYIERIKGHLQNINFIELKNKESFINILTSNSEEYNKNISFCHGDFSLDNLISNGNNIYMIDPIYIDNMYSSWILDAGKLAYSLKLHNMTDEYNILYNNFNRIHKLIKIIELTHFIRVWKYTEINIELRNKIEKNIPLLLEEIEKCLI